MVKKAKERAAVEAEVGVGQIDLFRAFGQSSHESGGQPSQSQSLLCNRDEKKRATVTTASTRWTTTPAMRTKRRVRWLWGRGREEKEGVLERWHY